MSGIAVNSASAPGTVGLGSSLSTAAADPAPIAGVSSPDPELDTIICAAGAVGISVPMLTLAGTSLYHRFNEIAAKPALPAPKISPARIRACGTPSPRITALMSHVPVSLPLNASASAELPCAFTVGRELLNLRMSTPAAPAASRRPEVIHSSSGKPPLAVSSLKTYLQASDHPRPVAVIKLADSRKPSTSASKSASGSNSGADLDANSALEPQAPQKTQKTQESAAVLRENCIIVNRRQSRELAQESVGASQLEALARLVSQLVKPPKANGAGAQSFIKGCRDEELPQSRHGIFMPAYGE